MKFITTFFNCDDILQKAFAKEIEEINSIISDITWVQTFIYIDKSKKFEHQIAYNKVFNKQFISNNWISQPILRTSPKLIGDFLKGLVFIEIQFGNSATLYRDYYKFQYGYINGLLSLAVLIVPTKPNVFFPTRPKSVFNMAEYDLAKTCLTVIPINVPVILIGLLPEN